jgi:hypothetical protein
MRSELAAELCEMLNGGIVDFDVSIRSEPPKHISRIRIVLRQRIPDEY